MGDLDSLIEIRQAIEDGQNDWAIELINNWISDLNRDRELDDANESLF